MDEQLVKELRDQVRPMVEQMIALAAERGLATLELHQNGIEIRVDGAALGSAPVLPVEASDVAPALDEHHAMVPVLSTLVGTFRTRPQAEKPPAAPVGTDVDEGQLLGFVESMGLTYEVHAPVRGRMTEILVEEGHPVEYGQPLVVLEAAD